MSFDGAAAIKERKIMFAYQIKFKDLEDGSINGGIVVDDGSKPYVICGCCGSILTLDEVELLDEYDDWNSLSVEIIGDD